MQSFFSKLNLRLIVIHFFAFLFFLFAFHTVAFLYDYKFLYLVSEHTNRLNFPGRFENDMTIVEQAGNLGLLTAYVISWSVSSRRDWFWLNSVIVFVLWFAIKNFGLPQFKFYEKLIMSPGGFLKVYSLWGHVAVGAVSIAIGLFIFLFNKLNQYINDDGVDAPKKSAS